MIKYFSLFLSVLVLQWSLWSVGGWESVPGPQQPLLNIQQLLPLGNWRLPNHGDGGVDIQLRQLGDLWAAPCCYFYHLNLKSTFQLCFTVTVCKNKNTNCWIYPCNEVNWKGLADPPCGLMVDCFSVDSFLWVWQPGWVLLQWSEQNCYFWTERDISLSGYTLLLMWINEISPSS